MTVILTGYIKITSPRNYHARESKLTVLKLLATNTRP